VIQNPFFCIKKDLTGVARILGINRMSFYIEVMRILLSLQ